MSEQIVLPGFSGDVVLVNGLCYEFSGYTLQPSEDLDVLASFDTCEECGLGVPSSSAFSSPSSSSEPVRCNDCDPQLADTYTVAFTDLVAPWVTWNGSHTVHWNDRDPAGALHECMWGSIVRPATSPGLSAISLEWDSATYPNKWSIRLFAYTLTYLDWEGPTDPCDPRGSYGSHTNCSEGANECDSVVATTCTVS